jgi:hypothetical protein
MKIKISIEEKNYLKLTLLRESRKFRNVFKDETNIIDIDEDLIDEIRDWASDKLQVVGFDMNYNLTEEGKTLESLIDKLYH